jgi:peptidyl-tRNA hydrolase
MLTKEDISYYVPTRRSHYEGWLTTVIQSKISSEEEYYGLDIAIDNFLASIRANSILNSPVDYESLEKALDHYMLMIQPRQYILMRNDMESLNSGRACAQAMHAANQMVFELQFCMPLDDVRRELLKDWEDETGAGFGTGIVLSVNEQEMHETVATAKKNGFHVGIVNDPDYKIKDGETFHSLSIDTCGYVFGRNGELKSLLSRFHLYGSE